jgi:putative spermidine/putrescine transport system permease protein
MAKELQGLAPTGTTTSRTARRKRPRSFWIALLLLSPAVLLVLALFVYPFFYGLRLSFDPVSGGRLANYANLFSDSRSRPR